MACESTTAKKGLFAYMLKTVTGKIINATKLFTDMVLLTKPTAKFFICNNTPKI